MRHRGCTYIVTNAYNKVLYTGVTSNLRARILEYKAKFYPKSFTEKYNFNKIVWYEIFHSIEEAIDREKQIKGGSRKDKQSLIGKLNPTWKDLWDDIQGL